VDLARRHRQVEAVKGTYAAESLLEARDVDH
jgi:hypothetical protein